jgi:hypothetical protein
VRREGWPKKYIIFTQCVERAGQKIINFLDAQMQENRKPERIALI